MTCKPAHRAARHRRCAGPHSCVCTAARRRWCGMEGPVTIRSGAPPGPGTPCQWKPHAVGAPALTAWSTVVRTVVGATARGRGRRSASGTRPIPSSRRGTCACWQRCHRQAIRAGLLQHTRPPLHPGHHRRDTRVCRPGPGRWCRPPVRPGCLLCARHRSEHKQEMRALAPVSPRRAGTGPRGHTRWLAPLHGFPSVHPGHHAVPRKG